MMRGLLLVGVVYLVYSLISPRWTVYTNNVLDSGYDHVYGAEYWDTFEECMVDLHRFRVSDIKDDYAFKPEFGRDFSCYRELF